MSGLGLAEPFGEQRGDFFWLFISGEVAGVGQQVELAAAGSSLKGLQFSRRCTWIFSASDDKHWHVDCGNGGHRVRTQRQPCLNGYGGFRCQHHARTKFFDHPGVAVPGRRAHQGPSHGVEQLLSSLGAHLGDIGSALLTTGFSLGLWLGADESQASHPGWSFAPEFKDDGTAHRTTDKDCIRQVEMIEQCESVRGELGHSERRSIGDKSKLTQRQVVAEIRKSVAAKIGNDGANAAQAFDHWTPIVAVQRCGMKEDYGDAGSSIPIAQCVAVRLVPGIHRLGGYAPVPGGYEPGRPIGSSGMPIQQAR